MAMEEANSKTPRAVPPLLAEVEVSNLPGFDVTPTPSLHAQDATTPSPCPPKKPSRPMASPLDGLLHPNEVVLSPVDSPFQAPGYHSVQPVFFSLPASPSGFRIPVIHVTSAAAGDSDGLRMQAVLVDNACWNRAHRIELGSDATPAGGDRGD